MNDDIKKRDINSILDQISDCSSDSSADSAKNMAFIMKKQMTSKIRLSVINLDRQFKQDNLVVLDIQKSLEFQMNKGLKNKMQ